MYPDRAELNDLKEDFADNADRADYVDRICAAWDFDVRPEPETIHLFRQWKDVFDQYPLLHSPAYHTFRALYGWEELPREGGQFLVPRYLKLDQLEGRTDPCEHLV